MTNTSPVDMSDIQVLRELAVSKDGTRVPVNILRRKGTPLDGNNPALLQGYGGYGHCMRSQFNCTLRLWFDRGGIYDMLRYELEPNGAFNVTEFGTVEEHAQFRAMHAYSPYHQVRDGTPYPAVLLLTGECDGRVSPANSRKMAARLQQANASANPILVLLSSAAGHGMGTARAERIAENADVLAFLFNQLGMTQAPARDVDRSV